MSKSETTTKQFAGTAQPSTYEGDAAMTTAVDTTKKTTPTRKAPAKKATGTGEVLDHQSGLVDDGKPKKAYTATGRGGVQVTRTASGPWAVDCKKSDGRKPAYKEGVITRFFATEAAAQAFATSINDGTLGAKNDWYAACSDAIVVEGKEVA